MKNKYATPEVEVLVLQQEDIVTSSFDDYYDNGENDQVWG